METITNMTHAASKAIWGPSSPEPASGRTGDVSKGEPYDAGNMGEHVEDAYPGKDAGTKNPNAPVTDLPTSEEVSSSMLPDTTKTTDTKPTPPPSSDSHSPPTPAINPSALKDSSAMPGDATAAQNDVRSPSDPDTNPENVKDRNNVDDTQDGMDTGDNPAKLDGPGPRPVAEIAKENGGDAGKAGSREGGLSSSKEEVGEDKDTKEEENHDGDKGLKYVKSSGLQADGGNFDATKPGAGREADRLLEEKGVKRDPNGGIAGDLPETSGGQGGSPKEKRSLKDKIKAKLHKAGPV